MKKILLFVMLSCFLHSFSQKDYSLVYDSQSFINKGVELYDNSKYLEAIEEFDKVSKLDPKYFTALYEKGLAFSASDKKDEAKAFFEDLAKRDLLKKHPTLFTVYASFLSNQKEYEASEKIFKEAEKYLSNNSNFLYNFALLYVRKEERQKAVDVLEKCVTINPNNLAATYLLGAIALEDGKITEGILAYLSYLIISPEGKSAKEIVLQLNKKLGENYLDKSKLTFTKSGDNFQEIDEILRNQLPLRKAYKVKSDIDDVAIRQIQAVVEYSLEHKSEKGFFETTYLPWVKLLAEQNQFESFSYYMLESLKESLGKKLTSKKKMVEEFKEKFVQKDLWNEYGKRTLEHFGKQEVVVVTLKNNIPYAIGQVINNKKEGKYRLLTEIGTVDGELNLVNDELDGLQKYYNEDGVLIEQNNYKAGKKNGLRTTFYSNGSKSIEENYVDDVLEGLGTTYYENGGKNCEVNFTKGERNGTLICLYPNGSKRSESVLINGKTNGEGINYNQVGDILNITNYKNDEYEGKFISYFDGKIINEESNYIASKVQNSYKTFTKNKTLEIETIYDSGKLKKRLDYFSNGKKSSETTYNDKGQIETSIYYDFNENKYFESKYKSDEFKSSSQYTRNNSKPEETTVRKDFVLKDFDGNILTKGLYEKGKETGEWNYYNTSGTLKRTDNYKSGKMNGLKTSFNKNGLKDAVYFNKNDTISGVYESYDNGILDYVYNYENGKRNGPYKAFYPDGKLKIEGFFIDDELNGERFTYWQNGNVNIKEILINDFATSSETFNPKGEKENTNDYKNRTGNFTTKYNNGTTIINSNLINGNFNGKYTTKDKFNNLMTESEYINNERHNLYKSYSPIGTVSYEANYYCGKINGMTKEFDLVGNLKSNNNYLLGADNGKFTRFYQNKSKTFEYNMIDDSYEGDYTYFNQKGESLLIINYQNNRIVSYTKKSKTGELNEKVLVVNETAQMISNYPNGKTAISINFIKGNKDGKCIIYAEDGITIYEGNFKNDLLEGKRTEYYASGKIYKIEQFKTNNYEGLQEYFKEDGKSWLKANYTNDELQGETQIFENGILKTTKTYESDELVNIK